jgi:hypothetical protein
MMRPQMARTPRNTQSPARTTQSPARATRSPARGPRKSKDADERIAELESELVAERQMRAEQTLLAEEAHAKIQDLQLGLVEVLRLVATAEARETEASAARAELARAAAALLVSRPRRAKGPPPLPNAKLPTFAPTPEIDVTDTAELIESLRPPTMPARRSDAPHKNRGTTSE